MKSGFYDSLKGGRDLPPPLSSVRKEAANTKAKQPPQKILLDSGSTFVAYC